jgi:hypothetical protein
MWTIGERGPLSLRDVWLNPVNRDRNRQAEIKELTSKGIIPHEHELEKHPEKSLQGRAWLMGSVSALINDVLPARVIVENMVEEAARVLQDGASLVKVNPRSKL